MVRKQNKSNRIDAMLDDLLADCQRPEDILGESSLLKQLSQRLVERSPPEGSTTPLVFIQVGFILNFNLLLSSGHTTPNL